MHIKGVAFAIVISLPGVWSCTSVCVSVYVCYYITCYLGNITVQERDMGNILICCLGKQVIVNVIQGSQDITLSLDRRYSCWVQVPHTVHTEDDSPHTHPPPICSLLGHSHHDRWTWRRKGGGEASEDSEVRDEGELKEKWKTDDEGRQMNLGDGGM